MGKTFNPAERLYIILEKASRKESNITIKQVWTEVFAVDPTDSKGLFLCIADLIELVNEAKEQLKKFEDTNNRLYLESFTNIDKVLSITNLNSDWGAPKNILNDTTMLGLQHCSLALSRKQSEIRVEETKLKDLRDHVESLINKILDGDISKDLKEILLENLENIRRAIFSYEINGADGLKRAIESSVGSIIVNKVIIERDEHKEVKSGFFDLLSKVNSLVTFAQNVKELLLPLFDVYLK